MLVVRYSLFFAVAMLSLFLGGCSYFSGLFAGKSNIPEMKPLEKFTPDFSITPRWKKSTGGSIQASHLALRPALLDGKLFVSHPNGTIHALSLQNGAKIWSRNSIRKPLSGGIGAGKDMLVCGGQENMLYAVRANNGELLWSKQLSAQIFSAPMVDNDVVVARTSDSYVYAVSPLDGGLLWSFSTPLPALTILGNGDPLLDWNSLYIGFDSGELIQLDKRKGTALWRYRFEAIFNSKNDIERMRDIDGLLEKHDGILYATSYQGGSVALRANAGPPPIWERNDIRSRFGVSIGNNLLFIADDLGVIWALDPYTGETNWKNESMTSRISTTPIAYGDYLVVPDKEGYLHWLRQSDGHLSARYRIGKTPIYAAPLVKDDMLIVVDARGQIVLFDTPSP